MVDISSLSDGPPLRLAVSPGATLASELYTKHPRVQVLKSGGARAEVCPEAFTVATHIGQLVGSSKTGGAALIVDYGDDHIFGSSLRVRHVPSQMHSLLKRFAGLSRAPTGRPFYRTRQS